MESTRKMRRKVIISLVSFAIFNTKNIFKNKISLPKPISKITTINVQLQINESFELTSKYVSHWRYFK